MDSELSSPGPRTFQGIMQTSCDSSPRQTISNELDQWGLHMKQSTFSWCY